MDETSFGGLPTRVPPSLGPSGACAQCAHRGITAAVQIEDDEDHPGYVLIRLRIDPAAPGLDVDAYSRHQKVRP